MALPYSYYDNFSQSGNPKGDLGDFAHASALYRRNNYRLAPKEEFLYHVVLEVNPQALFQLGSSVTNILNRREYNLLVSTADMPSYNIDTDVKNQYNRKKVVHTKLNYDPVALVFHDDQAGITTLLWEAYYRYYFQDGNYASDASFFLKPFTTDSLYNNEILNLRRYGMDRPRLLDGPFFSKITINQLCSNDTRPTFTSVSLINPIIQELRHGSMDQAGTGTVKTTMRFAYETVYYNRGDTSGDNPAGFADPQHYDVTPSPLQRGDYSQEQSYLETIFELFDINLNRQSPNQTFENTRQEQNLQTGFKDIIVDNIADIITDFIIPEPKPAVESQVFAQPQPFVGIQDNQEFVRNLRNNPAKLNDYSRSTFATNTFPNLSIPETQAVYDNLSPTSQAQVQQITLNNITNLVGDNQNANQYRNDLQAAGIIQ